MSHKLGSAFDVKLWPTAQVRTHGLSGQHQPLSEFSDEVFNMLHEYFAAAVRGEPRARPIGFQLLPASA